MTRQQTIEKSVKWMEDHARDNRHGYDQKFRWGEKGDYDCSAAEITAWTEAGVDLKGSGATNSNTIIPALEKNDFLEITDDVDFKTGKGLKRGDVLIAKGHHVAQYCGDGKEVEASINEKGRATGGKPGDQTGREFLIRSYRNYPWTHAYRYVGGKDEKEVKAEKISKADSKPINPDHIHYEVIAKNGLNVRNTASTSGKIITALPLNSQVSFDDDVKAVVGWTAIDKFKTPGGEWKKLKGYCSSKWLKKV